MEWTFLSEHLNPVTNAKDETHALSQMTLDAISQKWILFQVERISESVG